MFYLDETNVTTAFHSLTHMFNHFLKYRSASKYEELLHFSESRNGPVIKFDVPVCVSYANPKQRVLHNEERDANPFFHLFESLWMLAGRNDLAPLEFFISTFGNYSDDGVTLNGAYGYRWRHAHICPPEQETGDDIGGHDQLEILIDHLKSNPNTRRAVLQMWDVRNDLLKIDTSKDVCCNLSVVFSIRYKDPRFQFHKSSNDGKKYLNMTVFNRSNDAIWGMCGANAVHFSMLQEYVALAIGAEVGMYYQITNDLHTYVNKFNGDLWLKKEATCWFHSPQEYDKSQNIYVDRKMFDREVNLILSNENYKDHNKLLRLLSEVTTPFIRDTVIPMLRVYAIWKTGEKRKAKETVSSIQNENWKIAVDCWINRRMKREKISD